MPASRARSTEDAERNRVACRVRVERDRHAIDGQSVLVQDQSQVIAALAGQLVRQAGGPDVNCRARPGVLAQHVSDQGECIRSAVVRSNMIGREAHVRECELRRASLPRPQPKREA
jgi:hypothetical protein